MVGEEPFKHCVRTPAEHANPASQSLHAVFVASAYVPCPHTVQNASPLVSLTYPGAHAEQRLAWNAALVPAEQGLHVATPTAPRVVLLVPGGQALHVDASPAPVAALKLPGGQSRHAVNVTSEYFPAPHVVQLVVAAPSPVTIEILPASQSLQPSAVPMKSSSLYRPPPQAVHPEEPGAAHSPALHSLHAVWSVPFW